MAHTVPFPDLLTRRRTQFVLWRPGVPDPPRLVLGRFQPGSPPTLADETTHELNRVPGFDDLWARPASDCGLRDGEVYHYWFEVTDSRPGGPRGRTRSRAWSRG
jgi:pullulanase